VIDPRSRADEYRERAARYREDAAREARAISRLGVLRLLVFVLAIAAAAAAIANPGARWLFVIVATAVAIAFVGLVRHSDRLKSKRRRLTDLAHVNEQAAFRVERNWARIDPQDWGSVDETDQTRADLAVFGSPSLVQLLPAMSSLGRDCVRRWLGADTTIEEIGKRQDSAQELIDAVTFRDEMTVYGTRAYISADGIARFVAWAAASPASTILAINVASFLIPAATLVLVILQVTGAIAAPLWLAGPCFMTALMVWTRRRTRALLDPVSGMTAIASTYAEILALVERHQFRSAKLSTLQATLGSNTDHSARIAFRRLEGIAAWAEVRASPMLYALLQAMTMLDWHVARRLDIWRSMCGRSVGEWLGALGEVEGLAAVAALAHANPDWSFPKVFAFAPPQIEARALGHPLLAPGSRVANDIVIGPPGTLQLISGSNMSGKSTLLRAVGLNVVLAQAGAPVCAASMRCPPLRMHTSIHIHDSLQQGLSYFMAELRQLKVIIDAAERGSVTPAVLYLVDELLRGTNSEERIVAARIVARRLLGGDAIGMVTTHDLALFDDPAIAPHIRHYHFSEVFETSMERDGVRFDYRLHAGPATSRNALRLLALVGIAQPG
jgi:hypothetical protein